MKKIFIFYLFVSIIASNNLSGQKYLTDTTNQITGLDVTKIIKAYKYGVINDTIEWIINISIENLKSLDSLVVSDTSNFKITGFTLSSSCYSLMWECDSDNNLFTECMKERIKLQIRNYDEEINKKYCGTYWIELQAKEENTTYAILVGLQIPIDSKII